jgi:pimeloyl-ACP methyl ester carboxylesterase
VPEARGEYSMTLDSQRVMTLDTVTSRDGTSIAYWRGGDGPPLLLVHGAVADHSTTWRLILPELEKRFTVCVMDRRGRGESGDGPAYDLQREAEDVAAVVESIGAPVSIVGHSFGALCAAEAARISPNVHRLILYEGLPVRGADGFRPGAIDRLEALLASGDVERMLLTMLRDVADLPAQDIELLRSQRDAWQRRLANAPTVPRELRAEERYVFVPERFGDMHAPTLLLVGGDSPSRELRNAGTVARALPNARVVILPDQQRLAMFTAPDLFVEEIVAFLAEDGTVA